jgi:hypothetical protein
MPGRVLIPARWFLRHVHEHPLRLVSTSAAVLLISAAVLGYALVSSYDRARQGRIENCRAVNELSRKIYVTLADLGIPQPERAKYRPVHDCEALP